MAQPETTRRVNAKPASSRLTSEQKIALALRQASSHAKKQLAAEGYKLPTQNWTGGAVRNAVVLT
jgi:hypothetical protein